MRRIVIPSTRHVCFDTDSMKLNKNRKLHSEYFRPYKFNYPLHGHFRLNISICPEQVV